MRQLAIRRGALLVAVFSCFESVPANAQSVWDKLKQEAQKTQPQQQKPGQPPKSGQQQQSGGSINDSGSFTPPPGTKIEPALMAPIEQGAMVAVSPHGAHVATASHSGSRQVVIYDGVPGPKFDSLIGQNGVQPIVFSPDGSRYAYCGQLGSDWIVMVDGKELSRGSFKSGAMGTTSCMLGFTADSRHVYFTSLQDNPSPSAPVRFVFDGKAGPYGAPYDISHYSFSLDGNHFAYILDNPLVHPSVQKLYIDNQPAPYDAGEPQWSADSQHLYTKRLVRVPNSPLGSVQEVLLDGKPIMRADNVTLFIPPAGNMVVALVKKNVGHTPSSEFLVVGGKQVPDSELPGTAGIKNIAFSRDGKHYAAVYSDANGRSWVFSDGKRGQTYASIATLATYSSDATTNYGYTVFTADSSTLVYLASDTNANKKYVVYGGQESDQIALLSDSLLSPVKNHLLTSGGGIVTLDGKIMRLPGVIPNATQAAALAFTPDGEHYAFRLQASAGPSLYLDGIPQAAFRPAGGGPITKTSNKPYVFSPDSKHIAYFCHSANPSANPNDFYLCIDDKAVHLGSAGIYGNLIFSGDSNHLFWTRNITQGLYRIFVDGNPVADGFLPFSAGFSPETWQIGPDGNLLVLLQDDTSLKRLAITPSPNTGLPTLLSGSFLSGSRH